MSPQAKTLFEKVWSRHEVSPENSDTPAVLYIDLHLIHEVTSPQAFSVLRERGLRLRRTDLTLATMDHSTPTRTEQVFGGAPITIESAAKQIRELERNCAEFGVELLGLQSAVYESEKAIFDSSLGDTVRHMINEERYFVVVMAYDGPAMREGRKKRLWTTRASIRAAGHSSAQKGV